MGNPRRPGAGACLPLLLLLALLVPCAAAQPPAGNWEISTPVTLSQDTTVRGDITIQAGGNLTLDGATLTLELPPPREPRIVVQRGGVLQLRGNAGQAARIQDGALDVDEQNPDSATDFRFQIIVEPGGQIAGTTCHIIGAGTNTAFDPAYQEDEFNGAPALTIRGAASFTDCLLENNRNGIVAEGATMELARTRFTSNLMDLRVARGTFIATESSFTSPSSFSGDAQFQVTDSQFRLSHEVGRISVLNEGSADRLGGRFVNTTFDGVVNGVFLSGATDVTMQNVTASACIRLARTNPGANLLVDGAHLDNCQHVLLGSAGEATVRNITWGRLGPVIVYALPDAHVRIQNAAVNHSMIQPSEGTRVEIEGGVRAHAPDAREGRIVGSTDFGERVAEFHGESGILWLPYATYEDSAWKNATSWEVRATAGGSTREATFDPQPTLIDLELDGNGTPGFQQATTALALGLAVAITAAVSQRRP